MRRSSCIACTAMRSSRPRSIRAVLISNSAVHEIDIARWLLDDEFVAASVFRPAPANPGRRSGRSAIHRPRDPARRPRRHRGVRQRPLRLRRARGTGRADRHPHLGASATDAPASLRTTDRGLCRGSARAFRRRVSESTPGLGRFDSERPPEGRERVGRLRGDGNGAGLPPGACQRREVQVALEPRPLLYG